MRESHHVAQLHFRDTAADIKFDPDDHNLLPVVGAWRLFAEGARFTRGAGEEAGVWSLLLRLRDSVRKWHDRSRAAAKTASVWAWVHKRLRRRAFMAWRRAAVLNQAVNRNAVIFTARRMRRDALFWLHEWASQVHRSITGRLSASYSLRIAHLRRMHRFLSALREYALQMVVRRIAFRALESVSHMCRLRSVWDAWGVCLEHAKGKRMVRGTLEHAHTV